MALLMDETSVAQRILDHVDHKTTDLSPTTWREPVDNYMSPSRFAAELDLVLRPRAQALCPSAAVPEPGSYLARTAATTALMVVRGQDGRVRAFRNACRHRGAAVVSGSGCERSLVCPYHGWTYHLDGRLRLIPHEYGFPGVDKDDHGLAPVACWERHGLVFVRQEGDSLDSLDPLDPDPVDELAGVITPDHRLIATTERDEAVNWKILVESFLEGYHIRPTHPETFFPLQYDNLNVVETFGPNSRIAFPYRNIERLRDRPREDWSVRARLTFVYRLFPNVMVATFPDLVSVVVLEPVAVDRTMFVTYVLSDVAVGEGGGGGADLVATGAAEDTAVTRAIQQGLASGANEHFEFGLFEGAIGHFHRTLDDALASGG